MRNWISIFILSLFTTMAIGQGNEMPLKEVALFQDEQEISGRQAHRIPFGFSNWTHRAKELEDLEGLVVEKVQLVYTRFKLNPDFDQEELNRKRVERLLKSRPDLADDRIMWEAIEQTGPITLDDAREAFHGFVLTYRPRPTKESMEKEVEYLKGLLESADEESTTDDRPTAVHATAPAVRADVVEDVDMAIEVVDAGFTFDPKCMTIDTLYRVCDGQKDVMKVHDSLSSLGPYLRISSTGVVHRGGDKWKYQILWFRSNGECDGIGMTSTIFNVPGVSDFNVVQTVFERHPQWKNTLAVTDVTGSMSPYTAQMMAWVKKQAKSDQIDAFVFFNDGDHKADRAKEMGSVGGIYHARNDDYRPVLSTMTKAMYAGGGGDCPENNVEATLDAIENYPDKAEVVMVADNWATPRDLKLLDQVNRPVHVILCGAWRGVNIEYINLAYRTGGSVHTMEEDLDFHKVGEGEVMKFMGKAYRVVNNRVRLGSI